MEKQITKNNSVFLEYIQYLGLELKGKNLTIQEADKFIRDIKNLENLVDQGSLNLDEACLRLNEMFPGRHHPEESKVDTLNDMKSLRVEMELLGGFQKAVDLTDLENLDLVKQTWLDKLNLSKLGRDRYKTLASTFDYIVDNQKQNLERILNSHILSREEKFQRDGDALKKTLETLDGDDTLFSRFKLDPTQTISLEERQERRNKQIKSNNN